MCRLHRPGRDAATPLPDGLAQRVLAAARHRRWISSCERVPGGPTQPDDPPRVTACSLVFAPSAAYSSCYSASTFTYQMSCPAPDTMLSTASIAVNSEWSWVLWRNRASGDPGGGVPDATRSSPSVRVAPRSVRASRCESGGLHLHRRALRRLGGDRERNRWREAACRRSSTAGPPSGRATRGTAGRHRHHRAVARRAEIDHPDSIVKPQRVSLPRRGAGLDPGQDALLAGAVAARHSARR